jgi:predicted ATP-binding protein involved in virulence
VLIDEPEMSLHVAWQQLFVRHLAAIVRLSKFDSIIATHSPQIISDRWDLTVELGRPNGEANG